MQFDFTGLRIEHERQLIHVVEAINSDIEFANITKKKADKEELLDIEYLKKRYKKIKYRIEKIAFREQHECHYCPYFENRTCKAVRVCLIDEEEKRKRRSYARKITCPKDTEGNCPYGNDVGTCFGFCWKKILKEHNKAKGLGRNEMEERKNE